MDSEKLAERDRARRARQMQQAKLQAIVLLAALLAGTVLVVIYSLSRSPPPAVQKEFPPESVSAVRSQIANDGPVEAPAAQPARPAPITQGSQPPSPAAPAADKTPKSPEKPVAAAPTAQEVKSAIEAFLKAVSLDDKLPLVIPKPHIAARLKEHYQTRGLKDPLVESIEAPVPADGSAGQRVAVRIKSPQAAPGEALACFERTADGKLLLDWESFVGYSQMGWAEFRRDRPTAPVMLRAYVSNDDYFNYEFTDSSKFISVQMRSPDGSAMINGFCESKSAVASALLSRIAVAKSEAGSAAEGRVWTPVMVKVRFPPNAQSDHCVELLSMPQHQWLAQDGTE